MKHQAKKQTRNQHMPVVIVCILILVLAVMGLGMHFIKKYIPTKERMNLTEYYGQFCLKYGKHVIGTAILQLGWWLLFVLFLPWTGFLVPFLGVWFIWFVCFFLLYSDFDAAYGIEEKIRQQFPEQTPRYDE